MNARNRKTATPMTPNASDDLMDGGKERDLLEFWPGEGAEQGAALCGKVTGFREMTTVHGVATIAEFSPCVTREPNGDLFASSGVAVILSAALRQRINPAVDTGKVFAIAYDGMTKIKNKTARAYRVVEQNDAKLRDLMGKATNIDGDDLPF